MSQRGTRWLPTVVAAGMLAVGAVSGAAQEATPAATGHDHPAHIHLGTCTNLDPNPTYMLTDVTAPADAAGTTDEAAAIPVEESVTTVHAALPDLRSGGYAINIHQSVEDIGTYIACGNLTSAGDGDTLVVGLGELNSSGHSGIAVLTAQGDQTDVHVYLTEDLAASGATTASASAGAATPAAATSVEIHDLAFDPATIEIPVGSSVTWTNDDSVPHTATAQDRAALQSGTIQPGESFSQTFDTPGTYDYFCEFHANMKGTIVVQAA
jgi:plastocyanin